MPKHGNARLAMPRTCEPTAIQSGRNPTCVKSRTPRESRQQGRVAALLGLPRSLAPRHQDERGCDRRCGAHDAYDGSRCKRQWHAPRRLQQALALRSGQVGNSLHHGEAASKCVRQSVDGNVRVGNADDRHRLCRRCRCHVMIDEELGGSLRQGQHLRYGKIGRADWDHGSIHHAQAGDAMHAQLVVDHGVVVLPAHLARAAAIINRRPHVRCTCAVLDGLCRLAECLRTTDAPRPLDRLLHPGKVLRVSHRLMSHHGAHVRCTAWERHGALRLRLAQRGQDGEGVCPQWPFLALQGVLQRSRLRRIEQRHEGEHNVWSLALGIGVGSSC
mmetsp:Transcript_91228/g.236447  ORF Transcript_91228/g.236447 Transcript_91228/m.236447 type:complete len:330 (+) Transcript_91228:120-1109(+)